MRGYTFRGKDVRTKHWVYGGVYQDKNKMYIITGLKRDSLREVIPESVGQYANLNDDQGEKIFEGDVISRFNAIGCKPLLFKIKFYGGDFIVVNEDHYVDGWEYLDTFLGCFYQTNVVGNMFDGRYFIL